MREIVLTAIAHRESIIQPAFMSATLKRVRTIFIFNRTIEGRMTIKPIEHYPVVTLVRVNFAVNVARIIERVGGKPRQRYSEKRGVYLESLLTELLSRGEGALIAGFPTETCENGKGWRRGLLFARLFLRFFLSFFFFSRSLNDWIFPASGICAVSLFELFMRALPL